MGAPWRRLAATCDSHSCLMTHSSRSQASSVSLSPYHQDKVALTPRATATTKTSDLLPLRTLTRTSTFNMDTLPAELRLDTLPTELQLLILIHLSPRDLASIQETSPILYQVVQSNYRHLIQPLVTSLRVQIGTYMDHPDLKGVCRAFKQWQLYCSRAVLQARCMEGTARRDTSSDAKR